MVAATEAQTPTPAFFFFHEPFCSPAKIFIQLILKPGLLRQAFSYSHGISFHKDGLLPFGLLGICFYLELQL